jgi:hypothetical protein
MTCFSTTSNFLQENNLTVNESLLEIIKEYLNYLLQNLNLYFPKDAQESIQKNQEWIHPSQYSRIEVFIDIIARLEEDHSILSTKANLLLLPFDTTYLREMAFCIQLQKQNVEHVWMQ